MLFRSIPFAKTPNDRHEFVDFLTSNSFPFHGQPVVPESRAAEWFDTGDLFNRDHAALWIQSDPQGLVGFVILHDLTDDAPLFDLRLATRHRGIGLGTMALREVTNRVFTTMDTVIRFEGTTRADNLAMRKVFERSGFVHEAHYRDAWPDDDGQLHDAVSYAIIRRDWTSGETTPVPTFEPIEAR